MKPGTWSLLLAYLLLVGTVAWTSFDTQRRVTDLEHDTCEVTVLEVAALVAIFPEEPEAGQLREVLERLTEECGESNL